jgi:Ca2+-binding RTX toxin-like protein
VEVIPGEAGAVEPFGVAFGTTWTVPDEYVSLNGSFDYDIGVINLSTNIGNSTGWFGLQSVTAATITGSIVTLAGYPGDLQGGTFQYTSSDNVDFVSGNQLFYNGALDTYFGSSGAPLWWQLSGGPYIVGVNTFQLNNGKYNGGTMLTDDFFNRVVGWENDSPNNTIIGTNGDDTLAGSSGADIIRGLFGGDIISGGDGSDLIYGNQGTDVIYGNLGQDTEYGGQGNDTVYGGQGNDVVYGNLGNDIVYGNFGNDLVFGGQDADRLFGGQGNDTINGNLGNDTLFGNLGADRFVFGQGAGADVVMDFNAAQGDRLDVQGQTHVVSTAADGWALITLSGGGTIEMVGLTPPEINDSFFI